MFFLSLFFQCIYGCYVHSAILPTFHRRCYWLLQVLLLKRSLLGFWQNILQKGRIMYYVHVLLQLKVNCKLHVNWNFILYFTFSCNSLKYNMSWSGPLRVCVEKNMHIVFIKTYSSTRYFYMFSIELGTLGLYLVPKSLY